MDNRYDTKSDEIKLKPGCHIHFIGIGGSSMSGIAEIALHKGYKVSGSDRAASDSTDRLTKLGAAVFIGHNEENLSTDCELVVYTLAIADDNPEFTKAIQNNIPVIERGAFLGALSREYVCPIAVSGTHGKTTTTSMLASVMISGNMDPSIHVGGLVQTLGSNVRTGHGDIFVTEACEYHANFLNLSPKICLILNIEAEHLDFYKDLDDIKSAFSKLAKKVPEDGWLILCSDDKNTLDIAKYAHCNIVTYGIKPLDEKIVNANGDLSKYHYSVSEVKETMHHTDCVIDDGYEFSIYKNNKILAHTKLHVPGRHNMLNALAAAAAADLANCPPEGIAKGLEVFKGAGRRYELVGKVNGAFIIDDYAHHPTEIKATLDAAHTTTSGKIWCVFQPHTYSRALNFQNEFCEVFKNSDCVIVTDIYAAREPYTDKISASILTEKFLSNGIRAIYMPQFEDIASYLKEHVRRDDTILLLGAGTVNQIAKLLK
ncbi:MAG: UDP-N-acetylmuramate--L-alanine ligase [Clostridia bacterium]|nr:UDP-N-acetylmuramate--L-alanine ligase [Clostridia bacterium]MBQ8165096.1 UDP-N-acetylmuramate--L-alanine ligase [Clostridia bacterium]